MTDSDIKWFGLTLIFLGLGITFGLTLNSVSDTWKDVEMAKLRCAPSAAPSGSAP